MAVSHSYPFGFYSTSHWSFHLTFFVGYGSIIIIIGDWSLKGSEGKCMWWGIMMPCIYLHGSTSTKGFHTNSECRGNLSQINYVFPSTWNSLTAAIKPFQKACSPLCAKISVCMSSKLLLILVWASNIQPEHWCSQCSTLGMQTRQIHSQSVSLRWPE